MTLPVDHFRCHVLDGAAKTERLLLVKYRLFAQPEVGQLQLTFRV